MPAAARQPLGAAWASWSRNGAAAELERPAVEAGAPVANVIVAPDTEDVTSRSGSRMPANLSIIIAQTRNLAIVTLALTPILSKHP